LRKSSIALAGCPAPQKQRAAACMAAAS
jgi:hypothetical protein